MVMTMVNEKIIIEKIPAIIWGHTSDKLYLFVHGKNSKKEEAEGFAEIAVMRGFQVISFDLPEHGERILDNYQCTVQNGVSDLKTIIKFVNERWKNLNLFACSLGAYFSLLAYKNVHFDRCLFQTPVLDMERLIRNMMKLVNVNEEQLRAQREIPTPMGEKLSWAYFDYVKKNPVSKWDSPTYIIYGSKDNLTERDVLDGFVNRFNCKVQIVENCEHYFHTKKQIAILNNWIIRTIEAGLEG